MEADDFLDASMDASMAMRHPQHHDHDSDDGDDYSTTDKRRRWSYDENSEKSMATGHVTHALRRPAALVRANSNESGGTHNDNMSEIGFHQGQQPRHRSPLISSQHKKSSNRRPQQQQQQQIKKPSRPSHNKRSGNLRRCVVIGGVIYLLLMINLLCRPGLPPLHTELNIRPTQQHDPSAFERTRQDEVKRESRQRANTVTNKGAIQRRKQTRPPLVENHVLEEATRRYEFYLSDDERRVNSNPANQKFTPARLADLCGTHARNAALAHPGSFQADDALNSKARVMITGVLNPVGFRLALALKEKCDVEVITGIDPMYPNTIKHRLGLMERMQILATSIPRMIQPIVQPLLGLNPRINKKRPKNVKQPLLLHSTGEVNLLSFNPTHIIHLASYTEDEYRDETAASEGRINVNSPYISDDQFSPLYQMRSSMVAMEHILASIASEDKVKARPHFTYASSMGVVRQEDDLHSRVKLVDELLADAYHAMRGVVSVGLRFPKSVYGPSGRYCAPEFKLAQAAIQGWGDNDPYDALLETTGLADGAQEDQDMVFVDDIVDVIIASMQYRPERPSSPTVFNVGSESVASLSTVAQIMENLKPVKNRDIKPAAMQKNIDSPSSFQPTRDYLKWSPTTRLQDGILKLMAWHLDKAVPFGPPKSAAKGVAPRSLPDETGDAFLSRNDATTCSSEDALCNSGSLVLPCVSECSAKSNCARSVFDPIADLVREVTEGCDIVMYTQSLGYDVNDLELESQYMDTGKRIVCNFAFIPQESKLVKTVTKKVPNAQLEKFGIPSKPGIDGWQEKKIDGLNGRLLYKGWILLWTKGAMSPLSSADEFLLKMNPGKLFAPFVTHAMYVAENFPVTPNIQDVLFLVDEMRRPPLKHRSVYRNEPDGKKHKYVLEAEPHRQAVMLAAPLKRMKAKNQLEDKDRISVNEATKYMTFEIGRDPTKHESALVRRQREFYERVTSFLNRNDLRSPFEPFYKYTLKHYIRTRWIVHDLKAEQGRQLRCDWYQEHLRWGTEIDQLSFAYVMERRELERRVTNKEPDDRIKSIYEDRPELKELSDMHEWHPLLDEHDRLAEYEVQVEGDEIPKKPLPMYVRIMSERFMLQARKAWAEKHRKKKKH